MEIAIGAERDGMLLRTYLTRELRLSGGTIARLKKLPDGILLNGVRVTVRAVLHAGDCLTLALEDREEDENPWLEPVELPLHILYEDEDMIAANKPAGMPTHPSLGHHIDTLANAIAYYLRGEPFVFRPVNRLDRDTSGIVLVAKNRPAAYLLSEQLRAGQIRKSYLAILRGVPTPPAGEISAPIGRAAGSIMLRRVLAEEEGGAEAHTVYRTLASGNGYAAVLASPITGRTHQLRVHFAWIGCPIAGDTLYGADSTSEPTMPRQALHACELCLAQPHTGKPLRITAVCPDDMLAFAERSGLPAPTLLHPDTERKTE